MAIQKKTIFVRILGQSVHENFQAVSHEIVGLPAGTYHKFEMPNGSTVYYNDFGIRSIVIADSLAGLN